jgi:(1->4)-alpha-D-glucan 1-alpha-D-glucosylmutase
LRVPVSTYRLQFNGQFRIEDAHRLLPYLAALGISDIYASPLTQSRPGSTHGYDVTDPTQLDTELGSLRQLEMLAGGLRSRCMGLLLDIVPNHMAASCDNPYWMDVLEKGIHSLFAHWFDIDWNHPKHALKNKVLLPILASPFHQVVEAGDLTLAIKQGAFFVCYYDNRLPLSMRSYAQILGYGLDSFESALGPDHEAVLHIHNILGLLDRFSQRSGDGGGSPLDRKEYSALASRVKCLVAEIYEQCPAARQFINNNLQTFNGQKGDRSSFRMLEHLLDQQYFWLSYWRLANEEINYRRFFAVNELVGVRVEDAEVFKETHRLIKQLVTAGLATGLRVDHIDGLRDPLAYLKRLQTDLSGKPTPQIPKKAHDKPLFVVVEKILSEGESLRRDWPVSGTTGYDFLNVLNGIFIKPEGLQALAAAWRRFAGSPASFEDIVYEKKILVMQTLFGGEMRSLGGMLGRLAENDRFGRDLPLQELTQALVAVTACFPVYRTYIRDFQVSTRDRRYVRFALREAARRNPAVTPAVLDFIRRVLMLETAGCPDPKQRLEWLHFVMRWQQMTGPVMAKGYEDTSLYLYNPLVSANEVGGYPTRCFLSLKKFHQRMRNRQARTPHALSATTTHDTKRSEDVRARINVLSELSSAWERRLILWSRWNDAKKKPWKGEAVPDRNEEVLLYQTMLGAWPLEAGDVPGFRERLESYMVKAAREAKAHTRWIRPDIQRERLLTGFVQEILRPAVNNRFLRDFLRFERQVAFLGALNSLSQLVLKICCPGVPDFYQGSELWDLRLVDPDNRRPVDFSHRERLLNLTRREQKTHPSAHARELLDHWQDGRVKLYVILLSLHFRSGNPHLFQEGAYVPLEVEGGAEDHICAFARSLRNEWTLIVVPRLVAEMTSASVFPLGQTAWGSDSRLILPPLAPSRWKNIFTHEALTAAVRRSLPIYQIFQSFPVAVLVPSSKT